MKKSSKKSKFSVSKKFPLTKDSSGLVYSKILDFQDLGSHRLHLRFLKDGRGLLNIDAKHIVYLNETAKIFLKFYIEGKKFGDLFRFFKKTYSGISKEELKLDYQSVIEKVIMIIAEKGLCPIHDIGLSPKPRDIEIGFPLRVDLAITYNCNNKCPHCYIPGNILNHFPDELDLEGMKNILDKLWDLGVPHIALTGGEATTRKDLLKIIEYGQQKGFVMGVISNGRKFSNEELVINCVKNGLDYAQITLESHLPEIHDKMQGLSGAWNETVQGIKNFVKHSSFTITNTTICRENVDSIEDTVRFLHKLGLKVFAMNGLIYSGKGAQLQKDTGSFLLESELKPVLENILALADELGMRFIWYTPTQYCVLNPIDMGLGPKHCSAANISIGIQPNGDVIPCQSFFKPVGNILKDEWDKIWYSDLFNKIRNNGFAEEKCTGCEMLDLCGGGCPMYVTEKKCNPGHIGNL